MSEIIKPVYDVALSEAKKYDLHARRSPMYQGMARELSRWANVKGDEKVLCIAGGTGLDARALIGAENANHKNIYGFDLSFPMTEIAVHPKQGRGLQFAQASANNIPFPTEQFSKVVINAAGEYLWPTAEEVIGEISRVLKPNGRLVFNCQADELGSNYENDPQRRLRKKTEELVREAGLQINSYADRKKYGMTAERLREIGKLVGLELIKSRDIGIETPLLDPQRQLCLEQFNRAWMSNVPKEKRAMFIRHAAKLLEREGNFDKARHWVFLEFSKI